MTDSSYKKWQISIFSAFIFILVVNPYTYILIQKILGGVFGKIADNNGYKKILVLIIQTILYILLVRGSMDLDLF
jgi:hypothetical protein